jgi:hypothetical protein
MVRRAAMSLLLGVPDMASRSLDGSLISGLNDDSVASWSMDELTADEETSPLNTPVRNDEYYDIGEGRRRHRLSMRGYRNELWAAIKPDFMALMDEEIIDACKSTESELSSDDLSTETKVSYNEFLQQYKELTDWLGHIQQAVSRQTDSASERYLNQIYNEEMMKECQRQTSFNDYGKELVLRYPQLKQEILSRQKHVNDLWLTICNNIGVPAGNGHRDLFTVLTDVEHDVSALKDWVIDAEKIIDELDLSLEWSKNEIITKLSDHQVIQKNIESKSHVVSAVMKLCKWIEHTKYNDINNDSDVKLEGECQRLHSDAIKLERRWHAVWIASVEYQVRLEAALDGKISTQRKFRPSDGCHLSIDSTSDGAISDIIPFNGSEYEQISAESEDEDIEKARTGPVGWIVDGFCHGSDELGVSPNGSGTAGCLVVLETADVGYSSESHSYDDRETATCPDSGVIVLSSSATSSEKVIMNNVSSPTERQSMTSAYNSGSDLSDHHRWQAVHDVGETTAAAAGVDSGKGQNGVPDGGCCTDDDFSELKELSFDNIPMTVQKEDSSSCLPVPERISTRRSLDSLMPSSGTDRMYGLEKRVSSVEIIMDSASDRFSTAGQGQSQNLTLDLNGLSSCDASSEGTLSESEPSSDVTTGSDTELTPRKHKAVRHKRHQNKRSTDQIQTKTPVKRHVESLTEVSDFTDVDRFLRSSSDGAITEMNHSARKRSKMSRSKSDMIASRSPKSFKKAGRSLKFDSKLHREDVVGKVLDNSIHCEEIKMKYQEMNDSFSFTDDLSAVDSDKDEQFDQLCVDIDEDTSKNNNLSSWQDSDSDMDDFINIVTESRKAYNFTESAVDHFSKEYIDGVVQDPVEFMAPLATCQTNISCMKELSEALKTAYRVHDADGKIQQINDIIGHWQQLETVTVHQQQQCRLLFILYSERVRVETQLKSLWDKISTTRFNDLTSLESNFKTVQTVRCEMETQVDQQVKLLANKIQQFQNKHTDVNMSRFMSAFTRLEETVNALLCLCLEKETQMKKGLMDWHQLTELESNLEYVINDEEHKLSCLNMATKVITSDDITDTVNDLQMLCDDWSSHGDEVHLMNSLLDSIADICTADCFAMLKSNIELLDSRLAALKHRCQDMITSIQTAHNHDNVDIELETMQEEKTGHELMDKDEVGEMEMVIEEDIVEITANHTETVRQTTEVKIPTRSLRPLLKYAMSIPVLLMLLLYGGLYLLSDDWWSQLDEYGLWISPQMKHVRGAPPV